MFGLGISNEIKARLPHNPFNKNYKIWEARYRLEKVRLIADRNGSEQALKQLDTAEKVLEQVEKETKTLDTAPLNSSLGVFYKELRTAGDLISGSPKGKSVPKVYIRDRRKWAGQRLNILSTEPGETRTSLLAESSDVGSRIGTAEKKQQMGGVRGIFERWNDKREIIGGLKEVDSHLNVKPDQATKSSSEPIASPAKIDEKLPLRNLPEARTKAEEKSPLIKVRPDLASKVNVPPQQINFSEEFKVGEMKQELFQKISNAEQYLAYIKDENIKKKLGGELEDIMAGVIKLDEGQTKDKSYGELVEQYTGEVDGILGELRKSYSEEEKNIKVPVVPVTTKDVPRQVNPIGPQKESLIGKLRNIKLPTIAKRPAPSAV